MFSPQNSLILFKKLAWEHFCLAFRLRLRIPSPFKVVHIIRIDLYFRILRPSKFLLRKLRKKRTLLKSLKAKSESYATKGFQGDALISFDESNFCNKSLSSFYVPLSTAYNFIPIAELFISRFFVESVPVRWIFLFLILFFFVLSFCPHLCQPRKIWPGYFLLFSLVLDRNKFGYQTALKALPKNKYLHCSELFTH